VISSSGNRRGNRSGLLTAWDALSRPGWSEAGAEALFLWVGISLAMVALGHPTTLPVTLDEMKFTNTRAVAPGPESRAPVSNPSDLRSALPGAYQCGPEIRLWRQPERVLKETRRRP